jgi:hypothetical protein
LQRVFKEKKIYTKVTMESTSLESMGSCPAGYLYNGNEGQCVSPAGALQEENEETRGIIWWIAASILTHCRASLIIILLSIAAFKYWAWRKQRLQLRKYHQQRMNINSQGWVVGGAWVPPSERKKKQLTPGKKKNAAASPSNILQQHARESSQSTKKTLMDWASSWPVTVAAATEAGERVIARATAFVSFKRTHDVDTSNSDRDSLTTARHFATTTTATRKNSANDDTIQQFNSVLRSSTMPVGASPRNSADASSINSPKRRLSFSSPLGSANGNSPTTPQVQPRSSHKKKKGRVSFSTELQTTKYYTKNLAPSSSHHYAHVAATAVSPPLQEVNSHNHDFDSNSHRNEINKRRLNGQEKGTGVGMAEEPDHTTKRQKQALALNGGQDMEKENDEPSAALLPIGIEKLDSIQNKVPSYGYFNAPVRNGEQGAMMMNYPRLPSSFQLKENSAPGMSMSYQPQPQGYQARGGRIQLPSHFHKRKLANNNNTGPLQLRRARALRTTQSRKQRVWEERVVLRALTTSDTPHKSATAVATPVAQPQHSLTLDSSKPYTATFANGPTAGFMFGASAAAVDNSKQSEDTAANSAAPGFTFGATSAAPTTSTSSTTASSNSSSVAATSDSKTSTCTAAGVTFGGNNAAPDNKATTQQPPSASAHGGGGFSFGGAPATDVGNNKSPGNATSAGGFALGATVATATTDSKPPAENTEAAYSNPTSSSRGATPAFSFGSQPLQQQPSSSNTGTSQTSSTPAGGFGSSSAPAAAAPPSSTASAPAPFTFGGTSPSATKGPQTGFAPPVAPILPTTPAAGGFSFGAVPASASSTTGASARRRAKARGSRR